jgi:hypothetical protein
VTPEEVEKDPPSAPVKRGTLTEETSNTGGAVLISEKLVQRMIQQGKLNPSPEGPARGEA